MRIGKDFTITCKYRLTAQPQTTTLKYIPTPYFIKFWKKHEEEIRTHKIKKFCFFRVSLNRFFLSLNPPLLYFLPYFKYFIYTLLCPILFI